MAMRKIGLIVLALLLFAGLASAQIPTSVNVFFGYSYYNASALPVETGRSNLNGWEGPLRARSYPGSAWWLTSANIMVTLPSVFHLYSRRVPGRGRLAVRT